MRAALDAPIRTSALVLDRILASGSPALVVFETRGCPPCELPRPTLDEFAREFQDRVLVVRVTDSAEGWLAARYHLAFVPRFSSGGAARSTAGSRATRGARRYARTSTSS